MALTTARRSKKRMSSVNLSQVNYDLYEVAHVLRIKPIISVNADKNDFILLDKNSSCFYDSAFQETVDLSLLVLHCNNGTLLMRLTEPGSQPIIKQFEWFQNPARRIQCFCIDPVHAAWVVIASADMNIYILPALAMLKSDVKVVDACISWSLTDLTKMSPTRQTGRTTCMVWWHTLDDRNICIVGTEHGEIVFVDLALHKEAKLIHLREKITWLELMQDLGEHTTQLLVHTAADTTWQLLLEWPSNAANNFTSPSSFSSAFDMGYDMVAECVMDTILAYDNEESKEEPQPYKIKLPSQECRLSIQNLRDQAFIANHNKKNQTLKVFSDIDRDPEYSYQLPVNTRSALLTDNLIFAIYKKEKQLFLGVISKQFAGDSSGSQSIKKVDSSGYKAELQSFSLIQFEPVLNFYVASFKRPKEWRRLFPHSAGLKEEAILPYCIIVTEGGVMECRPRISPENYFTELCMTSEVSFAEAIGITLDMNVQKLCECCPIRRATNLIRYSSVTDGLIYVRQVLKHSGSVSSKDRKMLADVAVACYTEQILEKQKSANFRRTISESFMSFLRDNFDYDTTVAMDLLARHGLIDNLFEVAKTKGFIPEALEMCASRGLYNLSNSVQNMLLDRGFADAVCKANFGAFPSHMKAEEAIRFLMMKPEVTKSFIRSLDTILLKLEENSLLLVARLFDPSRSFIKPYLEKAGRPRSASLISLSSISSTDESRDDPEAAGLGEIFEFFLKTILVLNSKRAPINKMPDRKSVLRHVVGQNSLSSPRSGRSTSSRSLDYGTEAQLTTLNCGRNHIVFVSRDGDAYTWGRSSHGRLGHGDLIEEKGLSVPFRVEGLHMHGIQVLSVTCGAAHTIALCREGVYSWGFNNLGQLGVGDTRRRSRPCLISHLTPKSIISVVGGGYHTLAISSDYKAYAWGWGIHGQLGVNSAENFKIPVNISLLNNEKVIQVAAGYAHSAALTVKGLVFCFGAGLYGQLGIGVNTKTTTPKLVRSLIDEPIYYVTCGQFETLVVSEDQTIYSWGRNYKQFHICAKAETATSGRQLASNVATDLSHKYYPEELAFRLPEPITQVLIGNWHYAAVTLAGQLYTWGCNDCGQLGHYNKMDQSTPRLVKALSRRFITTVAAGSEFTVCVDAEDQVFAWGRADAGQLGIEGAVCKECGPTGMKKATVSILSPTAVPGVPLPSERTNSIGSTGGVSNRRDVSFSKDADFPDFSSIGHSAVAYCPEAILIAMQKLRGSYDQARVFTFCVNLKQFYAASFSAELQQKWDKSFKYGLIAIKEIYKTEAHSKALLQSAVIELTENILSSLEDLLSDDLEIENDMASIVAFVLEVFETWNSLSLPFEELENCLAKRQSFLAPILVMILYRDLYDLNRLPLAVQLVLKSRELPEVAYTHLCCGFLNNMATCAVDQIYNGNKNYDFLSDRCGGDEAENGSSTAQEFSSNNFDAMLKQILENKLKFHQRLSCISLSSVTVATVSAASSAIRGLHSWENIQVAPVEAKEKKEQDSVVFTCNHNFPRYYICDVILPEFKQRVSGLPKPLPQTADILVHYYTQTKAQIPAACPCCVYNSLRQEQLHLLQETGGEMSGNKSTFWEV
eukprot:gene6180-6894_t